MEDALVHKNFVICFFLFRLNPCFNGRCTRTRAEMNGKKVFKSLNPCFNGRCTRTRKKDHS